ncbi:TRAP transporter large permease [Stutzerimonas chloritidismutans]|uniref:TRAP transporter large permease n=1 Tax=Stutzerimonas chloritidismutans TaxID=203192 RepID=UPI003F162C3B
MDIEIILLLLTLALVVLVAIGLPVAYAIILSCSAVVLFEGINPVIIPQRIFAGMDSFSLMAIPFFLLAGSLMVAGGISQRLIDLANALVGRFTGGLAISNVFSSLLFGGVSGSAVADTSAMGRTYIPAMVKSGYDLKFSIGITAASSPISPLIPPSIAWIVYAYITDQSVVRMFVAGVVPGLLWALALMITAYVIARRRCYPTASAVPMRQVFNYLIKALPALMMPVLILAGIRLGIFTVTEASVLAVLYALLVSTLIYRELTFSSLVAAVRSSVRMTASVMVILAAASLFAWLLSYSQAPTLMADWIGRTIHSPLLFLLVLNVILLFVGTFMEVNAAKVMLLPVLFPVAMTLGIDPVHFGVIVTVNLCLGLITPPIGIVLALASKIGGVSIEEGTRGVFVFFLTGLVVLGLLTFIPVLSTGLPDLVLGVSN